jgi:hypothetical protein
MAIIKLPIRFDNTDRQHPVTAKNMKFVGMKSQTRFIEGNVSPVKARQNFPSINQPKNKQSPLDVDLGTAYMIKPQLIQRSPLGKPNIFSPTQNLNQTQGQLRKSGSMSLMDLGTRYSKFNGPSHQELIQTSEHFMDSGYGNKTSEFDPNSPTCPPNYMESPLAVGKQPFKHLKLKPNLFQTKAKTKLPWAFESQKVSANAGPLNS